MIFCTPITSFENTPKKIYLGAPLWDEFTSEYYNEKNDAFGLLFQKYTSSAINNIYHLSTVIEWKANMDNAAYKDNHDLGVYIPYEKSKLDRSINVDH